MTVFNSTIIKVSIPYLVVTLFLISTSFSQTARDDSTKTDFPNNLVFKPRILFGTGFDSPAKKGDKLIDVFGGFNLRLASDEESWRNRSISIFLELGILYITPTADLLDHYPLTFYFRAGPDIKIADYFLFSPYIGLTGFDNSREGYAFYSYYMGACLNFNYKIAEGVRLECEIGSNLIPSARHYPTHIPYLGIGLSFDQMLSITAGK